jgi:hypothetical protein
MRNSIFVMFAFTLTILASTLIGSDSSDCEKQLRELELLKSYYINQIVDEERQTGNFDVGQYLLASLGRDPKVAVEVLQVVRQKKRLSDVLRGLGSTIRWRYLLESQTLPDDLIFDVLKEGIVFNMSRVDRSSEAELVYFHEVEIERDRVSFFGTDLDPKGIALYMRGTSMFHAIQFAKMGRSYFKAKKNKVKEQYFIKWLKWLERRDAYMVLELELFDEDEIDQTLKSFLESESRRQK